ncbi:uncharacterized protein LOC136095540 [Hydra vulgaris]|uniref:uncharacterized protein LOC136095540 n=1 Tax=Hydra vulgaris TaxID=6087 RepID=UPI0032E9DC3A
MFQKQQKDILKLISGNLKITNERIDGLQKDITLIKATCESLKKENEKGKVDQAKSNNQLLNCEKVLKDIEESLSFHQDNHDKKVSDLEKKICSKSSLASKDKEKIRQLEDRQRRNNLKFEGIAENESESWDDSEIKIMNILENNFNVNGVKIGRAHRTGKRNTEKPRTIVIKLLDYKEKVKILKNANKLEGSGIFINEDYSVETAIIRKKLFEERKIHRNNGKYCTVIYDKLIVKDFKKSI